MNRVIWVDIAKGLGIVLVVLTHVLVGIHDAALPISESVYKTVYDVIFSIHMPLFFFLSGFFFWPSLMKKTWLLFVQDKMSTILYPYVVWVCIQGSIMAVFANYTNNPHGWNFATNLIYGNIGHFWFLHTLFVMSLLASIVFKLFPTRRVITLFVLFALGIYFFCYSQNGAFNYSNIPQYLIFFALGLLIHDYFNLKKVRHLYMGFVGVFAMAGFLIVFETWLLSLHPTYPHELGPMGLVTSLIAIMTVCTLSIWLSRFQISNWLRYLGERSLYIYLLHVLAVAGARIILLKLFGIESVLVHLIVQMLVGITIPLAVYSAAQRYGMLFLFEFPNHLFQSRQLEAQRE